MNISKTSISRKQSETKNEELNNIIKKSSQRPNKTKLVISGKTRNNKYREELTNKINNEKNNILKNNKSISVSKFDSEKHRIASKSSAKKKMNVGKSKPNIDIITKKQLLFQDEYLTNNNNNLYNNNNTTNTQRMLSNSVNLRNTNKGMRRTKSVEKKNPKKKVLMKPSKIFLMNNRLTLNKNRRYELDKKYKFNLSTMTKDDFNKIKEISEKLFTEEFLKKMINQDFNKQIEGLKDMKQNLDKNENIHVYLENFDIILKLISMKTYNNFNPALTKGLCEFLESLYNIVNNHEYIITDIEINIILMLLMSKLQINNIEIKNEIFYLMKLYISLFDLNKIVMQILNMTLLSNNKVKSAILEFILDLNENQDLNICNKNFIRIFALFLHCNDNDVKIRVFELFKNIYNTIGDELWSLNDVIAPKEKNYLKNNIFKDHQFQNRGNKNEEEEEEVEGDGEGEGEGEENENNSENDNENIDNNYEGNYNYNDEEQNDDFEEENEYENVIPIKQNNRYNQNNNNYKNNKSLDFNNRNLNIYHNYEKYETDNINNEPNDNYDDNNEDDNNEEDTNFNNTDNINDSGNILKYNDSGFNNTLDNNQYQHSYSNADKIGYKSHIKNNPNVLTNNISQKLNSMNRNRNTNKLIKNIAATNNQKRLYNNSLKNSKKNNLNLPNRKSKNQSVEKRPKNNKLLSTSSSSENITSGKELLNIMNNLSSDDESEKLNTIIIVHEILCTKYQENKYILIPYIDNIILIFIKITHDLFDVENIENISAKFAKYLVTILCKIASNKELITHITYKVLYDLTYELLKYLLISNLDKIGENQEGNIIFKSLNSAMLRILENCDTTSVILVLLEIIKQNQIKEDDYNLSNLAIKCLIKITQNLKEYINNIQLDKILLQMHLILVNYDKYINNVEIKTQTDIMTVKFIKNFIIDVVKIKRHSVLQDYNNSIKTHKIKDNHIFNWIKNTLLMLKNIETNKQIINDNISKSSINKTYNDDYDNENENENDNETSEKNPSIYNNTSENRINPNVIEENRKSKNNIKSNINNNNNNNTNNNNNNKMIKVNSKKISISNKNSNVIEKKNNFKDDYRSIIDRIRSLKQNLKDNNINININYLNNSTNLNRKKSIEINKKNKNKK